MWKWDFRAEAAPCMRRLTPLLRGIREEAREGAYTLVLEFETKEQMTLDMWESRLGKIQSFFGPGITAEVQSLFAPADRHQHAACGTCNCCCRTHAQFCFCMIGPSSTGCRGKARQSQSSFLFVEPIEWHKLAGGLLLGAGML